MSSIDMWSHTRPNAGVTVAPFIFEDNEIKTLVYLRDEDSEVFPGTLSLPNLFFDISKFKDSDKAANQALVQKTGFEIAHMEQLHTFTGEYIDPRRITVNICYFSVLRKTEMQRVADLDIPFYWKSVDSILSLDDSALAFNHMEVLRLAYQRIKGKAEYTPIGINFLEEEFTIVQFKKITELLLGESLNNARFRDRINRSLILENTGKKVNNDSFGKPAQIFRISPDFSGNFFPRSNTKVK